MSSPLGGSGSLGSTVRRGETRLRCLRAIVRDTQRSLSDVADIFQTDPEVSTSVYEIGVKASRRLSLMILGRDCSSKARLLNSLLGENVLPTAPSRRWRWIRFQFGNTRQVRLNLSNSEFELVEELECHRRPWTVMPEKDLQRRDPADLSTIMDIELNNTFLKDGLKIIIPPDLDTDTPNLDIDALRRTHIDFYTKRMTIMKQFSPICVYAINVTGNNIFSEHSCDITRRIAKENSRSGDEFWMTYNMYYSTRSPDKSVGEDDKVDGENYKKATSSREEHVFTEENCLDLQQVKELYPSFQIYFVLFSDSQALNNDALNNFNNRLSKINVNNKNACEKHVPETRSTTVSLEFDTCTPMKSRENTPDNTHSDNKLKDSDNNDSKIHISSDDSSSCVEANVEIKITDFEVHHENADNAPVAINGDKSDESIEKEYSSDKDPSCGNRDSCDGSDSSSGKRVSCGGNDSLYTKKDLFCENDPNCDKRNPETIANEMELILNLEVEATESTESTENPLYQSEELPESDRDMNVKGKESSHSRELNSETPKQLFENSTQRLLRQFAFMYDLIDQWDHMCGSDLKRNSKNNWLILDDAEILKNSDRKPLTPIITKAIANTDVSKWAFTKTDVNPDVAKLLDENVSRLIEARTILMSRITKYVAETVQSYLLDFCTIMSEIHINLLQQFILASFDMAREMQVVPKKIEYVAVHEQQLYDTINEKFVEGDKKEELVQIMKQVLQDMKSDINTMDWSVDDLPCHQEKRTTVSNSVFYGNRIESHDLTITIPTEPSSQNEIEQAISYDTYNFDEYDIITQEETQILNSMSYNRWQNCQSDMRLSDLRQSDAYVNDSCQSDIFRSEVMSNDSDLSLIRVENEGSVSSSVFAKLMDFKPSSGVKCPNVSQISIKQASLDVQKTVLTRLSRKISLRLIKFVDCLRDSYFGTLQRCLESLEASCREELGGRPATEAMRQVLSVARTVDLQTCASFSVLRTLVEHLRRLFQRLKVGGGGVGNGACCVLSPVWRRDVALHTLHTLSPNRLARLISTQILERLTQAHERYQGALATLAATLKSRLAHTEDVKLAIRKRYAPGFARLCLESTSMCDVLQHGTPELAREIGRGQYGVVYGCRGSWAGHEPCAIKSVLPSDERHLNELAMEFFYTRSIPVHERIVRLWGSVVQRDGSGSPTVLLIMERKKRDLYCAVRNDNMPHSKRMRIALDIVEGIRYLHSLGLVHRDIKMKNVLLDAEDRASLTDLGFCVPEALMSGSVVGTPVHMAPELLTGDYDSCVDVYAFGILFWYLCAGNIKLPSAFEMFQNKEQLWSKVRRGLRPERLPHFTDECWQLMESCWASEPEKRALLGDVQPILEDILRRTTEEQEATPAHVSGSRESLVSCPEDSYSYSRFHVV